ncbi:MAG: DnaJ C-terminal domain-containing protein [Clostridia bacterium]
MKYKNYYEILDVNRKSSKEQIKLAYRKLAKKYHPDTNKGGEADTMFKDINEAYDTLTNIEKRKKYDRQVAKYGYGFVDSDSSLSNVKYEFKSGVNVINDLLTTILGFKKEEGQNFGDIDNGPKDDKVVKQKPSKGSDIVTNLEVSLEEGYFGVEKKIVIKSHKAGMQTFSVNVPIGIKDGDKIRLAALGNPGKNGGKNGDLIIHVKVSKHNEFKLQGTDLTKEITVTPSKAALGGKYKLNIFNEKIFVSLPKHLRDCELVTVTHKGYISEDGVRGDLFLKIHIDMPKTISEREEKLYEQILKIEQKRERENKN